jgi:hypothetical protein
MVTLVVGVEQDNADEGWPHHRRPDHAIQVEDQDTAVASIAFLK